MKLGENKPVDTIPRSVEVRITLPAQDPLFVTSNPRLC